MTRIRLSLILLACLLAFTINNVPAARASGDSCTCSKQTDNSQFCTCVDGKGVMYCKTCPAPDKDGKKQMCYKVKCQ